MASSIPFRLSQATGLMGVAWLASNIAAQSLITIHALTTSQARDSIPATALARQWYSMYISGKTQNPPIAAATAASFSYLTWTLRALPGNKARLYAAVAVLTIGVVPWTILVMNSTNQKLTEKAKSKIEAKEDDKEVGDLLRKWGTLNGVRSLLPLVGSTIALFAVLA